MARQMPATLRSNPSMTVRNVHIENTVENVSRIESESKK